MRSCLNLCVSVALIKAQLSYHQQRTHCNYNLVSEAKHISLELNKGHLRI